MTRTFLSLAVAAVLAAPLSADTLAGVAWSRPADLASLPGVLRYVAPGVAIVELDVAAEADLAAGSARVLFRDESDPGDAYYLCDHPHAEAPASPIHLVYRGRAPGAWALLRLPAARLDEAFASEHFLYPLPERYELPTPKPAKRPAARAPAAAVQALLEQVDADRLRGIVDDISLVDPARGSVPGNIRSRYARRHDTFESAAYLRDQLAAILGPAAVRLDSFRITPEDSLMVNVVGELPGTDPEAGYWVVCAHYDAIGVRSRPSDLSRVGEDPSGGWHWQTEPAPGADDNATGVALVVESARLLSQRRFPWSIRFIAWSGEELGLWGSKHYAAAARARDERILGVLNYDMVGFNDLADRLQLVANPHSEWLVDLLRETNARYGLGLQVDELDDPYAGLSDHAPFWANGYDAILGIENYLPIDSTTVGVRDGVYRLNTQYHTVADLPDSVNWELVARVTRLTVAALAQFGAETGLPNLAVFSGDLRGDPHDDLRLQVANLGPVDVNGPFTVRLSRCDADSTNCALVYEGTQAGPVPAGGVAEVTVPWQAFGDAVLFAEVDPENAVAEEQDADNRAFFDLHLVPHDHVVVYPNPFRPERQPFARFSGVPRFARLDIRDLDGAAVWQGREEDRSAAPHEIRWTGSNAAGYAVGSGVYYYEVRTFEGDLVRRGELAVIR